MSANEERDFPSSFELQFFDELPLGDPPKDLEKVSNSELSQQVEGGLGALLFRAERGDSDALQILVRLGRNTSNELRLLAERKTTFVSEVAATYDEWPVVISLIDKTKSAEHWGRFLREKLKLGTSSFINTDRRRTIDLTNFWNRYVWYALKAMKLNKKLVPMLAQTRQQAQRKRPLRVQVDRTIVKATEFELEGRRFAISEWAEVCVGLPDVLSGNKDVIEQFFGPMKLAILSFWHFNPKECERALAEAEPSAKFDTPGCKRAQAFELIKQALETIAGK